MEYVCANKEKKFLYADVLISTLASTSLGTLIGQPSVLCDTRIVDNGPVGGLETEDARRAYWSGYREDA